MPIRKSLRHLYPDDWEEISDRVRFVRAGNRCEQCCRPHLAPVLTLPDGRWKEPFARSRAQIWRGDRGELVAVPSAAEFKEAVKRRYVLQTAHKDHNPLNNALDNLAAWCNRCHLIHDRREHLRRRKIAFLRTLASGDLFLGPYPTETDPEFLTFMPEWFAMEANRR